MSEIPLCIYCSKVVTGDQDYVILNKHLADTANWEYAHASCHAARQGAHSDAPEDFAVAI
ncbi:MAG TPA: hypothetical protein VFA89_22780 [Terriglobales bacterium]|nr:hypothetical protein [Terriglobales bacterium]